MKKIKRLKQIRGFTLVELMVAIGIFSVIVGIAVGGFVRALRAQRQITALFAANSNVSLALEQVAREIRTGYLFCHDLNGNSTCSCANQACTATRDLTFINAESNTVTYRFANGTIERGIDGGNFQPITGTNVSIQYLYFYLQGTQSGDGAAPRVTISLGLSPAGQGVSGNIVNVQTTVSSRLLDT